MKTDTLLLGIASSVISAIRRSRLVLLGTTLAVSIIQSPAQAANAWSAELQIAGIINSPSGGFLLLLPASNPACGSSGNQFYVSIGQNGMTAEGAKVALSLVLTAYATGRPISVLFDSAIAGCPVQQVYLKP